MAALDNLPDDILIPIFQHCFLDDIFSLRRTCHGIRFVVDAYITSIAPAVARTTFPKSRLLLGPRPVEGYSFAWLKDLVPKHLAAIALDKDKLRRFQYVSAGYPYGIPSEDESEEALRWRARVTNGWRVLQKFHEISRNVYSGSQAALPRPRLLRRMSSSCRSTQFWQAVSCPYEDCSEHSTHRLFASGKGSPANFQEVKKKERIILHERRNLVTKLSSTDLEDYLFVWRLLLWAFRPYRCPAGSDGDSRPEERVGNKHNWQSEINNIALGCSWLTWCVLHHGAGMFWRQWWGNNHDTEGNCRRATESDTQHYVNDVIWKTWNARSHHRREVEREYAAKFEFFLRQRCLSPERRKRLNEELWEGRVIKTISLDCIPWEYDQNPIILRQPIDFPWYQAGSWLWLEKDVWMKIGSAGGPMRIANRRKKPVDILEDSCDAVKNDPLRNVPYLIYLGTEAAGHVWGSGATDQTMLGIAF